MKNTIGLCLVPAGLFLVGVLLVPVSGYGQKTPSYLGVGAGIYNVFDQASSGIYYLVDYRPPLGAYGIGTWITLASTEEEMGYYSAGILKDLYLSDSIIFTPSFGIGIYNQAAGHVVLGDPVEFRSAIKLSYELQNRSRIGIRLGHVSNAGFGETNPGSELLSIIYSIRLNSE